jgi:dipeptidyl aminopeptidase/acylaminoacyl peptidase
MSARFAAPLRPALGFALFAALAAAAPSVVAQTPVRRQGVSASVASSAAHAAPSPYFTAEDALQITTVAVADLSDDGHWIALTESIRRDGFGNDYRHDGDPTYVHAVPIRLWSVDTRTGQRQAVFADKRAIRSPRWSPNGGQLAFLLWNGDVYEPAVWSRATGKLATLNLPPGKYVAETSDLRWNGAGTQLIVAVHTADWRKRARDAFANITGGPIIVQSSKEPFLAWDDLRRMAMRRSVGAVDAKSGVYHELVPEGMISNYTVADDGSAIAYTEDETKKTQYEAGGNEGRLIARTLATGATRTLLASTRGAQTVWSEDGSRYAFARDGAVYVGSIADTVTKLAAGRPAPARGARGDSTTGAAPPGGGGRGGATGARGDRFTASRFSPKGDALLVANRDSTWVVDLGSGARDLVMVTDDSSTTEPRVTFAAWSGDGSKLYFTRASRTKWERAIVRYDRTTKRTDELVRDGRMYSALRLSKDGAAAFLTVTQGNRPGDIYTGGGDLSNLHRFAESNPQLASKRLGATDLLQYLDADGHSKYGVVFYPANYEKGKAYPTVFIVYEEFFDDTWDVAANVLAANGYVVVKPSVDFDIGYPGEAWEKGVLAAANKLIEMGVADSSKLAVQGTSYGGYAVNLLVTQTNRFKAAINISGKVDMISFYTDSPRLGVRNITAAERQQDRLGATLWQQPQKYVAHSAIMFADRIQTPLMLITGQQDSNVPEINSREMYYALRRLGKEVVWVSYANGGHGGGVASVEDFLDENRRMLDWYDTKLKKPAPEKPASDDR